MEHLITQQFTDFKFCPWPQFLTQPLLLQCASNCKRFHGTLTHAIAESDLLVFFKAFWAWWHSLHCHLPQWLTSTRKSRMSSVGFAVEKLHLFNILIRRNTASVSPTSNIFKVNKPNILNVSATEECSHSLPHCSQCCIHIILSKNYVSINANM